MDYHIKMQRLSPAAHLFGLRTLCPEGHGGLTRFGRALRWVQPVKVHPLCSCYLIELRFEIGDSPQVLVRAPDLGALADGRELPHTYEPVDSMPSLCLWRNDWHPGMPLTALIPWAAEWFWFFEHWLVTGEWLGGGSHAVPIVLPVPRSEQPDVALKSA